MLEGRTGRCKQVKRVKQCLMGQFCQRNSSWRRLARNFSNEPKIALQISWRAASEFRYVWTGKFEFNTLHLKVEIFESEVESLRIQKYPDTCGRCLNKYYVITCLLACVLTLYKSYWAAMNKIFIYAHPCVNREFFSWWCVHLSFSSLFLSTQ